MMTAMGRAELENCLSAVHAIGAASASGEGFARGGVSVLRRLVPSELTTLSICDLDTGHRSVVSDVPNAISTDGIAAFDRHLPRHPLVCAHRHNPRADTRRISDLLPEAQFRCSPLFDEYYRPIGISHAMALPVHVEGNLLVSFVFNRSRRDFTDGERGRLEAIRPHLTNLYRLSRAMESVRPVQWAPPPQLTAREQDVLRWLAGGKTDRDIGEILAISPRTVHKHLQRIYEKLGVETRTAAVVRAMNLRI